MTHLRRLGDRSAQQYEIVTPSGRSIRPPRGRSWYATEPTYKSLLSDDRIWFPKDGDGSPRLKLFGHQLRGLVPFTVWGTSDTGTNDDAKRHRRLSFPDKEVFDTPKPGKTPLERIVHIATNPGDLVGSTFLEEAVQRPLSPQDAPPMDSGRTQRTNCHPLPVARLKQVVDGTDPGGITSLTSWTGGGGFDVVSVPPRFWKQSLCSRSWSCHKRVWSQLAQSSCEKRADIASLTHLQRRSKRLPLDLDISKRPHAPPPTFCFSSSFRSRGSKTPIAFRGHILA